MWLELLDAGWLEESAIWEGSENTIIEHYTNLNINPDIYLKFQKLCSIQFIDIFTARFDLNNKHYSFHYFNSAELILYIFSPNLRIFYSDNACEFLFNLKIICGLTIHSHSKILDFADRLGYDFWLIKHFIDRRVTNRA